MVNDEELKKIDIVKAVLEYMKPYMNLELYQYEKKQENVDDQVIVNSVFEEQSRVGRATGVAQSPKWLREALAKHFQEIEARKPKKVVWSDDSSVLG